MELSIEQAGYEVTSTADNFTLRSYFKIHCFSINPKLEILNKWEQIFVEMINDNIFIENHCNDQQHQIFLHQAILSALITKYIPRENLRILDAGYSYPLHFQDKLKTHDLFKSLEEMVCPVYEGKFHYPGSLSGIQVNTELNKWFQNIMN
ncbi:MAG: hypothetical protein ACP5FK_04465 [bacterium]